jgi:hypothetical protein
MVSKEEKWPNWFRILKEALKIEQQKESGSSGQ